MRPLHENRVNLRAFSLLQAALVTALSVVHSMRCKTSPVVEARVLIASGEW